MPEVPTHTGAPKDLDHIVIQRGAKPVEFNYMEAQLQLAEDFAVNALASGSEVAKLTKEERDVIIAMLHGNVIDQRKEWLATLKNPNIRYLAEYWIQRYDCVFGPLARVSNVDVLDVYKQVSRHQTIVCDHLRNMRHIFHQKTGFELGLKESMKQIHWPKPKVFFHPWDKDVETVEQWKEENNEEWQQREGEVENQIALFRAQALFPTLHEQDGRVDFLFEKDHIHAHILDVQIDPNLAVAVQNDINTYPQFAEEKAS